MNIVLNGDQKKVAVGTSISQLLDTYKIVPETIIVQLNGMLVQLDVIGDEGLSEGDQLEFIRFVGGG